WLLSKGQAEAESEDRRKSEKRARSATKHGGPFLRWDVCRCLTDADRRHALYCIDRASVKHWHLIPVLWRGYDDCGPVLLSISSGMSKSFNTRPERIVSS